MSRHFLIIGILSFILYSCTGENPKKSAEQVRDKPAKYTEKRFFRFSRW